MMTNTYLITCAAGLESSLLLELESFGIDASIEQTGRIAANLTLEKFYQVCLWSRVASRVLLPIITVPVQTKRGLEPDIAEQLYLAANDFDWSVVFDINQTFVVKLSTDKKFNVNQQFATLRVKDAIVDSFIEATGKRPSIERDADNIIHVSVSKRGNTVTHDMLFCLDLTGTSLHRRGYRHAITEAPLKENLAAALLYQTGWHKSCPDFENDNSSDEIIDVSESTDDSITIDQTTPHQTVTNQKPFNAIFDPMCGSGTLLIEALLMWTDYAVGIDKDFCFVNWQKHDADLWEECIADAHQRNQTALENPLPKIIGYDADSNAIDATYQNMVAAGFKEFVDLFTLETRSLAHWSEDLKEELFDTKPLLITNPPYGERLGATDTNQSVYKALGLNLQTYLPNQHAAVVAAQIEDADVLPFDDKQNMRTHNGQLIIYLRQGRIRNLSDNIIIHNWQKQSIEFENAQDLVNRLQKNLTNLRKNAKKEQVQNLRIYDADLPNYNLAIDVYGEFVHVQEYAAPKQIDPETAKQNFNTALQAIRLVLNTTREQVFIKTRRRQKGNEQYEKTSSKGKFHIVTEANVRFYVNLTDYLDTGLFLDHRPIRTRIQNEAKGKRVLNLYAYTCSASVHAAVGGASKVTSVDLSNTYLDWGKRNFALNGLVEDHPDYEFIYADVFEWLKGSPQSNDDKYDLIFIDPPTFSNSKKVGGIFDIQRDHVSLIKRALNRLATGGVIYFSNNYRDFEMSEEILALYNVQETTNSTIGFDFSRKENKANNSSKKIHQSWKIEGKN